MADEPEDVIEAPTSTLRARLEDTHDDRVAAHDALQERKVARRDLKRVRMAGGDNPVPPDKRAI